MAPDASDPNAKKLKLYGNAQVFTAVGVQDFGPSVARQLSAFQRNIHSHYFSSFAVASNEKAIGVAQAYHSRKAADQFALKQCQARSGTSCRIAGRILPVGFQDNPGVRTVSRTAARAIERYRERPGPKAFAIGDHKGWGGSQNGSSLEAAKAQAVRGCNLTIARTSPAENCQVFLSQK